jgi:hypothetical protein
MFSVRLCVLMSAAGPLMGDMRVWLDKQRTVPAAFHCRDASAGVEIEISFDKEEDAEACAEHFHGLVLVTD